MNNFDNPELFRKDYEPHHRLIRQAVVWLRRTHGIVLAELCSAAGESPDAIGWSRGFSTVIECKTSRGDFFGDAKKPWRCGGPCAGNYRFYLVPEGLIAANETPDAWGLLYSKGRTIVEVVDAPFNADVSARQEGRMMLSALRRCRAHLGVAEFDRVIKPSMEPVSEERDG